MGLGIFSGITSSNNGSGGGGGGGNPSDPNESVQFNNSGAFGGSSNFLWDEADALLKLGGSPITHYPGLYVGPDESTLPSDLQQWIGASNTLFAGGTTAAGYALVGIEAYSTDPMGNGATALYVAALGTDANGSLGFESDALVGFNGSVGIAATFAANVLPGIAANRLTGVLVSSPFLQSGASATEVYGIQVQDQTGATNNWAIKTGLGLVELGDNVWGHKHSAFGAQSSIDNTTWAALVGLPGIVTVEESSATGVTAFSGEVTLTGGGNGLGGQMGVVTSPGNPNNFAGLTGFYAPAYHAGTGDAAAYILGVDADPEIFGGTGSTPLLASFYSGGPFVELGNTATSVAHFWGAFTTINGTVVNDYGVFIPTPTLGGSAVLSNHFSFWSSDMAGIGTNPYYSWFDSRGVRRVKEDSTFDSVGQAIEALYNPQFTKYTPGAANYERIVLGQWNGNVAEIGAEKGGTGTLRPLRFLGNGYLMGGSPITPFNGLYVGPDESTLPIAIQGYFGATSSVLYTNPGTDFITLGIETATVDGDGRAIYVAMLGQGTAIEADGLAAVDGDAFNLFYGAATSNSFAAGSVQSFYAIPLVGSAAGGGTMTDYTAYYAGTQLGDTGITTYFGFYGAEQKLATNNYYSWFDSRGVMRVREDSAYNGTGQAILALYNNSFAKYVPGAVDYERSFMAWDASNVLDLGTEAGGTGTLRDLRLKGANIRLAAKPRFDAGNATGAGTALLGTNAPSAHLSAPYTWIDVLAADGTLCTMPMWQK